MNINHKIFIIFSLVIFFIVWYSKSKYKYKSKSNLKENMENQSGQNAGGQNSGCENAPLFLAMKNSSEISELKKEVKNISQLVDQLQTQNMNEATDIITSMTGSEEGVSPEEIDEVMT
jgi:hypothetical protein